MAPVAINFRARHGDDPAEVGKWNSYHAALSKDGLAVASGTFNINNTGTQDTPEGAPYLLRNMLTAWPARPAIMISSSRRRNPSRSGSWIRRLSCVAMCAATQTSTDASGFATWRNPMAA
jgi:hypothetical protein